jgi:Family of unknown function (DUF6441)
MRIQIKLNHPEATATLKRWAGELRENVRKAAGVGLRKAAPKVREAVQRHAGQKLKLVRSSVARSFTTKVFDQKPNRLPALLIYSRIPWMGMHETGGTINGKLLIPLHGRVGRKTFNAQIKALRRGGNAYFVRTKKGTVVLMAENQREYDKPLSGFKRRFRQATGSGRLKRGADVPIAVLVSKVRMKKRLDVRGVISANLTIISDRLIKSLTT